MTLSIITHTVEGHSAFCDLTRDEKALFEHGFAKLLADMQDLMWMRRVELGKDKG